jgi:hypothetical protein
MCKQRMGGIEKGGGGGGGGVGGGGGGGGGGGRVICTLVCPKQHIYFSMDCMVIVYSQIQYLIVQVFSCSVDNDKEWLIIRTWS